jgi:FkbM family methyltransferase
MKLLKQLIAKFPHKWQIELKRLQYRFQINQGSFITDEPEYKILHNLLNPGDWVIDIGANVGHYTKRFSELVGSQGRVIALEPVPTTFSLLSSNVLLFPIRNVSLINAAVSDRLSVVGMSVPKHSTGLVNYYRAHVLSEEDCDLSVLTICLDSLCINQVALVKIDVEGHEAYVLKGMRKLIEASRPYLIVETDSEEVIADLKAMGYVSEKLLNSPNVLFKPFTSPKVEGKHPLYTA